MSQDPSEEEIQKRRETEKAFEALEKLMDTLDRSTIYNNEILVKKEDLTEKQREAFLFIFGEAAFNEAENFLVRKT